MIRNLKLLKPSRLSFILLLLIALIMGGVYVIFYGLGHTDCIWSGTAQAWLDENENGVWDAGEPPLANVHFVIDDAHNNLTDVGDEAISDETGQTRLTVWLPSCPRTAFEVTAESPPEYVLTSAPRLAPDEDNTVTFSFAF